MGVVSVQEKFNQRALKNTQRERNEFVPSIDSDAYNNKCWVVSPAVTAS
jgi:hypothetical protein